MADTYNIYQRCPNCKGTGKVPSGGQSPEDPGPPGETDCSDCNGTGEVLWGQMREEEPGDA